MTPEVALAIAITVSLVSVALVSLVAGLSIAIVVLKAAIGKDDKPPL